jgi:hypothetical protein
MKARLRFGLYAAAASIALFAFVGAANAGQIFGEKFHDEEVFPEADFCGVDGLNVTWDVTRDGHAHAVSRGRDKLPYFGFNTKSTEVVTNDANGNFVTARSTVTDKDLRVTDNGDGTLTLLILATGNAVLYGMDGEVIARNPGQVRFEILIDHGGTPTDPSDDEFLEFLGEVKGSTGRTDDFCEAAVPILLGS